MIFFKASVMKQIFLISAILFSSVLFAQTDVDALRYSMSSLAGTARYNSMGGAFSALGGDMASLSNNPGGIAIFQRSEFSFSPAFYVSKVNSQYLGSESSDSRFNMNFAHAGVAFAYKPKKDNGAGWKNWNFGIVYNRLDNYQTSTLFSGYNDQNSLLDYYLENINSNGGTEPGQLDPFYEYQAYQTYLLNYDTTTGLYSSVIPDGNVLQRESRTTRGARGETLFSFGGNFNHKLYVGANIGLASLRYDDDSDYEESDINDTIFDFKSFRLNQSVSTRGFGVNFKFGFIYRMLDQVRIGAAVHSPTYYQMHDDYFTATHSAFDNGDTYYSESPAGVFDYDLRTPFRAIGSLAFVIGKKGIISGEYEYVDYSDAELDRPDYAYFEANDAILKKYTSTGNFRLGTEWVLNNISFRGGYAFYGSPFQKGVSDGKYDLSKRNYSAGIGVRDKSFFVDFGYVYTQTNYPYYPYVLSDGSSPVSKNEMHSHNLTITLGVKF